MSRKGPDTLGEAIDCLKSDRAPDRAKGREILRNIFQKSSTVLHFDKDGDGRHWLSLFQALFESYAKELKACISKTGALPQITGREPIASKRLGEVASVLRWLTERSVERLNSRVLKSLLVHLTRGLVYQGNLLPQTSLDYAKAINTIINYRPHLHALKDAMWHDLLALAFNVVVGYPPKRKLAEDIDVDGDGMGMDSDVEMDDAKSYVDSDMASETGASPSKLKRTRQGSPPPRPTFRRGASTLPGTPRPVTLEQIEFMSILSKLLRSTNAPILTDPDEDDEDQTEVSDPHKFPRTLLKYFSRFLRMYPGDTSLHHDFLVALSAALSHLTVNCRQVVASFAHDNWHSIVSMWGTKNQSLKEHLIIILRQLFPFLTADILVGEESVDAIPAVAALWSALEGASQSRGGPANLSLDSLQLCLADCRSVGQERKAFVAATFRHGWHFDGEQALSWALLELQADCAEKLYLCTESTYSSATVHGKRIKLENPISSLLQSIKSQAPQQVRTHHLQVLLFFVDRHWSALHAELRRDIIATLGSLVSFEDVTIQSWTFVVLAAIAHSDPTTLQTSTVDRDSGQPLPVTWDSVWTHAMRRANVPAVSRAACHAAHALLTHSVSLLSSQRVLVEVESFARDLDVQGPPFPYDSVCDFMVLCLRMANQDVRLYRMQMEEKVLSWLMESWRIGAERRRAMPLHTAAHIHALLESITGSSRRARLQCGIMLPHGAIVDALVEETHTKIIRDFQLHAHLPPYRLTIPASPAVSSSSSPSISTSTNPSRPYGDSADLSPPRGRERRLSAFLLKSLEETSALLENSEVGSFFNTAERIRSAIDLAVISLCYEGSLLMNGTQTNRRVLQAACKLLGTVAPCLLDHRWKAEERRLILGGFDPLIRSGDDNPDVGWEALVPPGKRTGIRMQVLTRLLADAALCDTSTSMLRELQRFVFRSADVQDAFTELLKKVYDLLRLTIGRKIGAAQTQTSMDDGDDFGPIRSAHTASSTVATRDAATILHNRFIVDMCVTALAVVPVLQSQVGEPTRGKELVELVLDSNPDEFLILVPPLCDQLQRRTLSITTANMEAILQRLDIVCAPYAYKHNDETLLLVVRLLDATSNVWLQPSVTSTTLGEVARFYCWQMVKRLQQRGQRSWRVQDAIIRFLDSYLMKDPKQEIWQIPLEDGESPKPEDLPAVVLPLFGNDCDIRIRFRMAAITPRLFIVGRIAGRELMSDVYQEIRDNLCTDQSNYESILTRLLCLGSIVIAEASVRRGAYWHLLEIAYFSQTYFPHLKSILNGIIERMDMKTLVELSNCYASQFAYSIREALLDVLKFPPELLGYRDRRKCAEATFRSFAHINLLAQGSVQTIEHGQDLFARHCQAIQKTKQAGIQACFSDLVAFQIVFWLSHFDDEDGRRSLEDQLREKMGYADTPDLFCTQLEQNVDDIIVNILRSLGDQDVSRNGPIAAALIDEGLTSALDAFQALTQYRSLDAFETHTPNLPNHPTVLILHAIAWFSNRVESASAPSVTYHVLQQLFADIEHTPLVNEQYRLLNAVCLWVACHHRHFEDESLLRTLTRRSAVMLAQVDLSRGAQSILEWCFSLYKTSTISADYRFADVLIRTSVTAHDFSQLLDDPVAKLGADLILWVEGQAERLRRSKHLRKQVARALSAWPRELPFALQSACEGVKLSELTSVLVDQEASASKFRLVRRIDHLAAQEDADERFGAPDFWRLKACIPPESYLTDSDIEAFTSLLMVNRGHVDNIGNDRFEVATVRTIHRRAAESASPPAKGLLPRVELKEAHISIVTSLRGMLDTSTASQAHVAYQTLRHLMSASDSDTLISASLPGDMRRELQYLQTFVKPFPKTLPPDVHSILSSEPMLQTSSDFDAWVPRLTTLLCEALAACDPFFAPLPPILYADHGFAEEVLPVLVHCLLQVEYDDSASDAPRSMRETLSHYFSSVLSHEDAAIPCYRAIIGVILHLRNFHPHHKAPDALAHDKWLSIDFTLLSRCAIRCNAYTTSLLFLELASDYPALNNPLSNTVEEQILFDIYSHIDEPDGFYGIQTGDLHNYFVQRLRHERQWDKAFSFHGAAMESGSTDPVDTDGIVQSLCAFGFNQLALNTMHGFSANSNVTMESSSLAYNLGWRAETWDLPDSLGNRQSGTALYLALRAVYRERDPQAIDATLRRASFQEMERLRDLGTENLTEMHQVVQNLMCLGQIRQWRSDSFQKDLQSKSIAAEQWKGFTSIESTYDFNNIEAIMATRISLIRSARLKEQRDQIGDLSSPLYDSLVNLEKSSLLCLSERSRGVNQTQIALNSVVRAQKLERVGSSETAQEFANVLWLMKEPKLAIKSLATVLASTNVDKTSTDVEAKVQHAMLLARLGTWSAEASMKKPSQIVDECFNPAVDLVLSCNADTLSSLGHSYASVFHQYALFAERQYHILSKSPDALRLKFYVDRKREEKKARERQFHASPNADPHEQRQMRVNLDRAQKVLLQDETRYTEFVKQRTSFLSLSVEMYARCLASSDNFDEDSPIRLCSLWLANFDNDDSDFNFHHFIDVIPSRKFVFLAHQLTARLSTPGEGSSSRNQRLLQAVIRRMGREHPFHTLFPLYCLRVDRQSSQVSRRQSQRSVTLSQTERASAVSDIFAKLRSDSVAGERVQAVEHVCDASLELAKHPIKHIVSAQQKKKTSSPVALPNSLLVRKIKNLKVPVITAPTPIDPSTEYRDCIWIGHYEEHCTTAGGVNLPKIVRCYGSNGRAYKQLYKGEGDDDMRQDAVMEQVFELVNVVLRHDRQTQRRKLGVRGYKVIPLAAQAGVLEFVDNTTPLHAWLNSAHARYQPELVNNDPSREFRTSSGKLWREDPAKLIRMFMKMREVYKPVMRHYFTEKHKSPMSWFTMRLLYSRSVATTSIVGHILGLGDRHTSNILMDNKTGEVVHIDLGIAFEQGKLLPQPERVPFRLTADMVDGLGISGTQGVFQRCAEETLRVLRQGSETILTVLEVFKYDPLHSWTANQLKVKRVQAKLSDETAQLTDEAFRFALGIDMASDATHEAADRALSTVARKLDKTLSVEYTVNDLVTEASDPTNLALMYAGWSPHL